MAQQTQASLKELQRLDAGILRAEERLAGFDPQLADVDRPAQELETEAQTTRGRLQEMRLEERRLELSADERRARAKMLQERLNTVKNLREEAAVSAELEMVRQALEGDEQEALTLLDQIKKLETRLREQEERLAQAREEIGPRRGELLKQQKAAEGELASLRAQRDEYAKSLEGRELRMYESIRGSGGGGGRVAVTELTLDGACGHCYSMIPLQLRNEVRHGTTLIRCEACGVILTAPEDEDEGA